MSSSIETDFVRDVEQGIYWFEILKDRFSLRGKNRRKSTLFCRRRPKVVTKFGRGRKTAANVGYRTSSSSSPPRIASNLLECPCLPGRLFALFVTRPLLVNSKHDIWASGLSHSKYLSTICSYLPVAKTWSSSSLCIDQQRLGRGDC